MKAQKMADEFQMPQADEGQIFMQLRLMVMKRLWGLCLQN